MKKVIIAIFVVAILTLSASFAISQDKGIISALQKAPEPQYQAIPDERFGLQPPPIDLSHIGTMTPSLKTFGPLGTPPSSFDLRTQGKVTPVENQNPCGTCWTFATTGSIESRILLLDSETYDFSEQNIAACAPNYFGSTCDTGGNIWLSANLLSTEGTRQEAVDSYTCPSISCGTPTCNIGLPIVHNLTGMRIVCDSPDETAIKNAIYNYGAVYTSMYASFPDFSSYDGSSVFCYTGAGDTNHAVLIVGWDDTMDAGACGTGAWIVKNSWGSGWGDSGYFYIAYGSAKMGTGTAYLEYKDYDQFENIYYYDDYGMTGSVGWGNDTIWGAVRFTPAEDGDIKIVDFWATDDNMTYSIYIYDDWTSGAPANLLHSQSGSLTEAGFYSISLSSPVGVSVGDEFVVVIKFVASGYGWSVPIDDNAPIETNKCYVSNDGSSWLEVGAGSGWDVGIRARNVTNQCPVANDQVVVTDENTPVAITLGATDGDGNSLIYSITTHAANGNLSGTAPDITYTPDADYKGSDSFTFKASDGQCDSNTATVSINIFCFAVAETCNNLDDDCDGDVDNGNPGGGGACDTGQQGECAAGTEVCQSGALECIPDTTSQAEACEGLDNDCDGVIDNGNPGGGGACNTGQLGECAAGTEVCQSGALQCVPDTTSQTEVCDGLDNDCDGNVDEGCVVCPIIVPDDYSTIQSAINVASNGCEIMVRNGTYVENINFLGKAITVLSENGAGSTTIDGSSPSDQNFGSVVTFANSETNSSILSGFTLTNGSGTDPGEGRTYGGGIYCSSSSPTITNCIINSNSATYNGGGIHCISSSPIITNCIISGNSTTINGDGGGINCSSSSPQIINCVINGNSAFWDGGGIKLEHSSPNITNCIISRNTSNGYGGGIYCRGTSSPTIINCTISGNIASDTFGGGAIACFYSSFGTVVNSILWSNSPDEIRLYDSSGNVTYSDIQGGYSGAGNINADPLFVNAAGGDYHLQLSSSCINSGTLTGAPEYDFEGDPRLVSMGGDDMPDMGADEFYIACHPDGDVNGDSKVSAIDALWILEYLVQLRELDDCQIAHAGVAQPDNVSALDALCILEKIVQLPSCLD